MNEVLEWVMEHAASITEFIALITIIGGMIRWSHVRLHADMMEIKADAKSAHNRIDAMGNRIDAMGNRIDHMYTVMMSHITGIKPSNEDNNGR